MGSIWRQYKNVFTTRDFAVTAATGIAILVNLLLEWTGNHQIAIGVAIAGTVIGGFYIVQGAVRGLLSREINVDELVSIAIVASFIAGEYLAAAGVVFMMMTGKILEDFTSERARNALEALCELNPTTARVRRNGEEVEIPIEQVAVGDLVLVRSGERIPVDGLVASGQASVNQAPVTGESMAVPKNKGNDVFAGTLNELGVLEIKATKVGDDTTLSRICQLVEEAEVHRAPVQRAADTYAKFFTPAILSIATLTYVVTTLILSAGLKYAFPLSVSMMPPDSWGALWPWSPQNYPALLAAVTVLIVACPCSLILATPTAIIAGVANGARRGILIKGGARLEMAGRINAVALDKTGTMTMGEPNVLEIVPLGQLTERQVMELAGQAEKFSEHPLGRCVVARAREMGITPSDPDDFQVIPGRGVVTGSNGNQVVVGTPDLLQEQNVTVSAMALEAISRIEEQGKTALSVALNGEIVGILAVADTPKAEVQRAVASLFEMGIERVVMLTGDNPKVAERIAREAGITEFYAQLLPDQKVEWVKRLQAEGYRVAMVGDGINDAPALATADAAIAMGAAGTDVAMDTADIILIRDDITKIPEAIGLSRKTLRVIKQNIGFALMWNVAAIIAAAFGELSPVGGAIVHNIGSVAVVVNSARLVGTRDLVKDYPFLPNLRRSARRATIQTVSATPAKD